MGDGTTTWPTAENSGACAHQATLQGGSPGHQQHIAPVHHQLLRSMRLQDIDCVHGAQAGALSSTTRKPTARVRADRWHAHPKISLLEGGGTGVPLHDTAAPVAVTLRAAEPLRRLYRGVCVGGAPDTCLMWRSLNVAAKMPRARAHAGVHFYCISRWQLGRCPVCVHARGWAQSMAADHIHTWPVSSVTASSEDGWCSN